MVTGWEAAGTGGDAGAAEAVSADLDLGRCGSVASGASGGGKAGSGGGFVANGVRVSVFAGRGFSEQRSAGGDDGAAEGYIAVCVWVSVRSGFAGTDSAAVDDDPIAI